MSSSFDGNEALLSGFKADPPPEWITEPDVLPMTTKRQLCAAVKIDSHRLLVVGGKSGGDQLASTEVYDSRKNEWKPWPALNEKRSGHAAVVCHKKVYVVGGRAGYGTRLDSVECLDLTEKPLKWETLPVKLSSKKSGCAAVAVGSMVVILGGDDGKSSVPTVDILFTATGVIKAGPSMTTARNGCAAGVVNHVVYVVGGEDEGDLRLNTMESISLGQTSDLSNIGQWQLLDTTLTSARFYPSVAIIDHCLVVMGGSDNDYKYLSSAEVYDTNRHVTWSLPDMNKTRWGSAAVTLEDSLVMVTGGLGGGTHASMEMLMMDFSMVKAVGSMESVEPDVAAEMKQRIGLLESLVEEMTGRLAKAEKNQEELQTALAELSEQMAGMMEGEEKKQ